MHALDLSRNLWGGGGGGGGLILVLTWSKTFQDRSTIATVSIPTLSGYDLCSVGALRKMFYLISGFCAQSLFQIFAAAWLTHLTDSAALAFIEYLLHSGMSATDKSTSLLQIYSAFPYCHFLYLFYVSSHLSLPYIYYVFGAFVFVFYSTF